MNGIHDMGGMHGFGPVPIEQNEPVFHADWEGRVFAMNLAMLPHFGANIDRSRFMIESIPPAQYLASSYYERWLASVIEACRQTGLFDEQELAAIAQGRVPEAQTSTGQALSAEQMQSLLIQVAPFEQDHSGTARFAVGDSVRARNLNPHGHTRLPRYVRSRAGEIVADNGKQIYPDDNARRGDSGTARLYTVRFLATELWGEQTNARDSVCLDLWEPYLEPA